jgi:hypothetical protein
VLKIISHGILSSETSSFQILRSCQQQADLSQ